MCIRDRDDPACTRDTLWCQHYVRTSKEYLINCHILLQYFEKVFLQLQLVQILCKLIIIWQNYEKTKRGPFYETPCIISYMFNKQQLSQQVTQKTTSIETNNQSRTGLVACQPLWLVFRNKFLVFVFHVGIHFVWHSILYVAIAKHTTFNDIPCICQYAASRTKAFLIKCHG